MSKLSNIRLARSPSGSGDYLLLATNSDGKPVFLAEVSSSGVVRVSRPTRKQVLGVSSFLLICLGATIANLVPDPGAVYAAAFAASTASAAWWLADLLGGRP